MGSAWVRSLSPSTLITLFVRSTSIDGPGCCPPPAWSTAEAPFYICCPGRGRAKVVAVWCRCCVSGASASCFVLFLFTLRRIGDSWLTVVVYNSFCVMWEEKGKGTSDDDPQKKCDTSACAWPNSDAVREISLLLRVCGLLEGGKRRVSKEGEWDAAGFGRQKYDLPSTGYILLARRHASPATGGTRHPQLQACHPVKPQVWRYSHVVQHPVSPV